MIAGTYGPEVHTSFVLVRCQDDRPSIEPRLVTSRWRIEEHQTITRLWCGSSCFSTNLPRPTFILPDINTIAAWRPLALVHLVQPHCHNRVLSSDFILRNHFHFVTKFTTTEIADKISAVTEKTIDKKVFDVPPQIPRGVTQEKGSEHHDLDLANSRRIDQRAHHCPACSDTLHRGDSTSVQILVRPHSRAVQQFLSGQQE